MVLRWEKEWELRSDSWELRSDSWELRSDSWTQNMILKKSKIQLKLWYRNWIHKLLFPQCMHIRKFWIYFLTERFLGNFRNIFTSRHFLIQWTYKDAFSRLVNQDLWWKRLETLDTNMMQIRHNMITAIVIYHSSSSLPWDPLNSPHTLFC